MGQKPIHIVLTLIGTWYWMEVTLTLIGMIGSESEDMAAVIDSLYNLIENVFFLPDMIVLVSKEYPSFLIGNAYAYIVKLMACTWRAGCDDCQTLLLMNYLASMLA